MIKFSEIYGKIRGAVLTAFGRTKTSRELTPEEMRQLADLWLAKQLKAYILKASGERHAGIRWEPRKGTQHGDGHPLLIKTGLLYRAVANSTVTVMRGKNGQIEFQAEVEDKPYPKKKGAKGKPATTGQVFLYHQYGTPKMPARPIFTKLSSKDQKEIDMFIETADSRRQTAAE
jgi:hypothetical protein